MSSPRAIKTSSTFRMHCQIAIEIRAPATRIWALLTNAGDFPRWNTTVTSLEGEIALGQKLKLRVPISDRTFTPKVTELDPPHRMVWSDGAAPMFKGVRTFSLSEKSDGVTEFEMSEVFSGVLLPLIKGSLPDFGPPFEAYANDLKREAERAS
jgi:hypothetical protein